MNVSRRSAAEPWRALTSALVLLLSTTGTALAQKPPPAFTLSCASCHTVRPGEDNGVGPNLHNVAGGRSGSAPDFDYSPALAKGKVRWTDPMLDRFLQAPSRAVPGTTMPFAGLPRAADRAQIIAFLKGLKAPRRK